MAAAPLSFLFQDLLDPQDPEACQVNPSKVRRDLPDHQGHLEVDPESTITGIKKVMLQEGEAYRYYLALQAHLDLRDLQAHPENLPSTTTLQRN